MPTLDNPFTPIGAPTSLAVGIVPASVTFAAPVRIAPDVRPVEVSENGGLTYVTVSRYEPAVFGAGTLVFRSREATTVTTTLGTTGGQSTDLASRGLPDDFPWDDTFPVAVSLSDVGTGSVGMDGAGYFDAYSGSLCRSAPTTTYYVATGGSDAAAGTTPGAPLASIHAAITKANATGQPAKIVVSGGTYYRANSLSNNGTQVIPTVDIAFIANGLVRCIAGDAFSAPTLDATHTNVYSWSRGGVNNVVDLTKLDEYGRWREFRNVADAATCNRTPDSWAQVGSTLYVNRGDGLAVLNTNTRVYLNVSGFAPVFTEGSQPKNLYFGGTNGGMWILEGGQAFDVSCSAVTQAAKKLILLDGVTSMYPGGLGAASRGFYSSGIYGLVAYFDCRATGCGSDGFSQTDIASQGFVHYTLHVNCTADDVGRFSSTSNNGLTNHLASVCLDVAGTFLRSRGGTVRCINSSKTCLVGTTVGPDIGDIQAGGTVPPTAIMADGAGTPKIWLDRVKIVTPAGTRSIYSDSTGVIYSRDLYPHRGSTTGAVVAF